jgi:6-phosphogluconate dehydrogenase
LDAVSFVSALKRPRKIILLVQAGSAVDSTIQLLLSARLEDGDIIVDGGNEWYPNSIRRHKELSVHGIHFVGMGVSGGEEGARNGPSLMLGGSSEAYAHLEPILSPAAAKLPGSGDVTCISLLGPIGAGNYVKMVHNGIEYADMQLIAEIYHILKNVVGLTNSELSKVTNIYDMCKIYDNSDIFSDY